LIFVYINGMAKKKQVLKEEQKIPDYDSAWKEVQIFCAYNFNLLEIDSVLPKV